MNKKVNRMIEFSKIDLSNCSLSMCGTAEGRLAFMIMQYMAKDRVPKLDKLNENIETHFKNGEFREAILILAEEYSLHEETHMINNGVELCENLIAEK